MTQNDFDQFQTLLQAVSELYGKPMTPFSVSIYWGALQQYDMAVVREAMNRHITNPDNGQFMPKPADLIRMMQGSSQDKALQAWHKVDKAVRCVGTYSSVVFDDPLIHRVLHEMGGWIAMGRKTEDEWPFVAREFEQRYRAFAGRQETPEHLPVLVGIIEADSRREGFPVTETPMLIGDANVAMAVMMAGTNKPALGMQQLDVERANEILLLVDKRDAA